MHPILEADKNSNYIRITFNQSLTTKEVLIIERAILMLPEFADTRRPSIDPNNGQIQFRYAPTASPEYVYENFVHNVRCIIIFAPFIDSLED